MAFGQHVAGEIATGATGIVLAALGVSVAAGLVAMVRLRAALDGVELTLRVTVTGLRLAARAAGRVPAAATAIATDSAGGQEGLARLGHLKGGAPAGRGGVGAPRPPGEGPGAGRQSQ